jgi:hypothetical protein
VVTAYAGILAELRARRTGLLLGALGPGDAEGFGLRLPPRPAGPPGRGLLVVRGRAVTVQVALPSAPPGRPEAGCPDAESLRHRHADPSHPGRSGAGRRAG